MCWYFKKRRIKSSCYVIICCLFWNLVTIIIAFVPVHVYTLKFGEKITFYHFSKKCLFSVFLHIEAQLSLKNARLPPVFFLDFNSGWYDLLVSQSLSRKKYFPLVGTVLKWLNKGYVSSIERRGAYLFFFFYMCDSYLKAAPFQLKAVEYFTMYILRNTHQNAMS